MGERKKLEMMERNKQELARRIKEIGESLIKNADSIVGNEQYIKSVYISAEVSTSKDPVIEIDKEFWPEMFIDRTGNFGPNDI